MSEKKTAAAAAVSYVFHYVISLLSLSPEFLIHRLLPKLSLEQSKLPLLPVPRLLRAYHLPQALIRLHNLPLLSLPFLIWRFSKEDLR